MADVLIHFAFLNRLQETRYCLKMLLPQRSKLRRQLRRQVRYVRQVLGAIGKRNPVVAGKGDAGFGRRWLPVVVERDIRGCGSGIRRGEQASNESLLRRRRLEEQHRIVGWRALEVDLGEAGKLTTPQGKINRPQIIEKPFGVHTRQRARKGHHRVVKRERVGLGVIRTEVSRSTL